MANRARTAVAALATTLACAGCGFGPGVAAKGVNVRVTRAFGTQPVKTVEDSAAHGTVMQTLQRSFAVKTRYGGGFVDSIAGHSRSGSDLDWFYYVNGVQAPQGAATTKVHQGDHIWWDLHDWTATNSIPAVVGSFPEPFTNGVGGQRYTTGVACASGE